jgi:hypothetical protein
MLSSDRSAGRQGRDDAEKSKLGKSRNIFHLKTNPLMLSPDWRAGRNKRGLTPFGGV